MRAEDLARLAAEAARHERQVAIERFGEQLEAATGVGVIGVGTQLPPGCDALLGLNASLTAIRLAAPELDGVATRSYNAIYDVARANLERPRDQKAVDAAVASREASKGAFVVAALKVLDRCGPSRGEANGGAAGNRPSTIGKGPSLLASPRTGREFRVGLVRSRPRTSCRRRGRWLAQGRSGPPEKTMCSSCTMRVSTSSSSRRSRRVIRRDTTGTRSEKRTLSRPNC